MSVVLGRAQREADALTGEAHALWLTALDHLPRNPAPLERITDPRLSLDPPIDVTAYVGEESAIIVLYHYLPYQKTVWVLSVEAFAI